MAGIIAALLAAKRAFALQSNFMPVHGFGVLRPKSYE